MNQRDKMLNDIGIVGFVLDELVLFLDTHPTDRDAIEHFNHYNRMKNQMLREFSQKYYPLTVDTSDSGTKWKWAEAPLPWEGGCA